MTRFLNDPAFPLASTSKIRVDLPEPDGPVTEVRQPVGISTCLLYTSRQDIKSKEFGRIATQNAKNVILQKIREEERKVVFDQFYAKEREVVTGIVQRYIGRNISVNLGKADAMLNENEQVRGEVYEPTERIKVFILEVKDTTRGPRILVSRTHPEPVSYTHLDVYKRQVL